MNKKPLAVVLLCFSLLLPLFPKVLASSNEGTVGCELGDPTMYSSNSSLSLEELLGLPGYITPNEEPIFYETEKTSSDNTIPDERIPPGGPPDGGTPMPAPVYTQVIVDDDLRDYLVNMYLGLGLIIDVQWSEVLEWAHDILEGGDDQFESWFNINFAATQYKIWESPGGSLPQLLVWGQQAFPKTGNIDVTFIFTGQFDASWAGYAEKPGDAFIISAWAANFLMPLVNVWQHEASHLYACDDHGNNVTLVCIMSYFWLRMTRNWCSDCTSTIAHQRYQFGTIWV